MRWEAWYVPGRIEVLGKHTDYGGGRSLICAAERGFHVVSAPRADRRLSLTDLGRGISLVLDADGPRPEASWATYPLTVLRRLSRNFPEMSRGVDVVFESDLPSAAGMSSSSALMVAVLLALVRANRLDDTARWIENLHNVDIRQSARSEDLAAYAATIENGQTFRALAGESGVGTEGGSEDHTAILCSRPMELAQYAFCPTRHERSVAFPAGLVFAIGVSGVAARKTGQARDDYNRASRLAARVLERWRTDTGRRTPRSPRRSSSSSDAPERVARAPRGRRERRGARRPFRTVLRGEHTARAGRRRRTGAGRPGRIRPNGRPLAAARRGAASQPGARNRDARTNRPRAWCMGGIGVRSRVRRERLGPGRPVRGTRVSRSMAECLPDGLPGGRGTLAVLPDEARAGGRAVEVIS